MVFGAALIFHLKGAHTIKASDPAHYSITDCGEYWTVGSV